MKTFDIEVENFGPIKRGKIETTRLNIICGPNNSGKSIFLHSFYSFLAWEAYRLLDFPVPPEILKSVQTTGTVTIPLSEYSASVNECLDKGNDVFIKRIPDLLLKQSVIFKDATIHVTTNPSYLEKVKENRSWEWQITENCGVIFSQSGDSLVATFVNTGDKYPDADVISLVIKIAIKSVLVGFIFNNLAYLVTSERTGAAMFANHIPLSAKEESQPPESKNSSIRKPFPVAHFRELDFISHANLTPLSQKNSRFAQDKKYDHIFNLLHRITSGTYIFDEARGMCFIPDVNKTLQLDMSEVSSSIRSLMSLHVLLRHRINSYGAIVMIDEPEINLTPHNQRLLARLLVQLAKAKIDVFITTHSDYIVREINTLVALNQKTERTKKIANDYGYGENECIKPDDVALYYIKKPEEMKPEDDNAFERIVLNGDFSVEIPPFDDSIREMGNLQSELSWED